MVAVRHPANLRRLQKAGQFTALVDILFATIGIFVIVFALQELVTTSELKPAPYDALILCDPDRTIRLYRKTGEAEEFSSRDISGPLSAAVEGSGRALIGLAQECAAEAEGVVVADRLREMAEDLSERREDGDTLDLFEFAPLGGPGTDAKALIERFASEPGGLQ
ncbi:hypothetical protein ACSSV8_003715 [Roseovarius sp. MBR-79]|jgi:hypothetical protein